MARIRTIKPEFPQSETVGRLSRDARLLFIMIWTIADDAGRARASSRMLASLLYPYDDDAPKLIVGWLDELEDKGCIRRYEDDGNTYLEIVNWLKHQKIDRPTPSRLPEYHEPSRRVASPREPSRALDADLGPGPGPGPSTGEGASPSAAAGATAAAMAGVLAGKLFEDFWRAYPKRDGANPKEPTRKKFVALLRSGENADAIIGGAASYATELTTQGKVGTVYVAQALTWINQQRWKDYAPRPEDAERREQIDRDMAARGYEWVEGTGWQKRPELAPAE